jgi:hypothetical protein
MSKGISTATGCACLVALGVATIVLCWMILPALGVDVPGWVGISNAVAFGVLSFLTLLLTLLGWFAQSTGEEVSEPGAETGPGKPPGAPQPRTPGACQEGSRAEQSRQRDCRE